MDILTYQKLALRTESKIDKVMADKNELNHLLNAFIVIGEMIDCYKKWCYYGSKKKYDEQFSELVHKLQFFAGALERHNNDEHNIEELLIDPRFFHGVVGIASESAELVSAMEKALNGHELDPINIQEELGDGAGGVGSWYSAVIHDALNLDPEETMKRNIQKLAKRYPEGFSEFLAENRDLNGERKILEGNS